MNDILIECANLAKEFEGLHDLRDDGLVYAYHDPVGYPTIGYGHLLSYVKYHQINYINFFKFQTFAGMN